jgi:hypothetical protein
MAKFFDLEKTSDIQRIWIVVGESYPKGTLIVAQGKFDPDRLQRQFTELARTRKATARLTWEGEHAVLSTEVPTAMQPVPGVPGTMLVARSGNEYIFAAFEKETLLPALARAAANPAGDPAVPMLEKLDAEAAISWVALIPESLAAPKAAFAGGDQVFGAIKLDRGVVANCTITATKGADDAQIIADRMAEGVAQTLQLLPTLAQSSMDPKLVTWLTAALKATHIKIDANRVNLSLELYFADKTTGR